jgi:hypothetical protein
MRLMLRLPVFAMAPLPRMLAVALLELAFVIALPAGGVTLLALLDDAVATFSCRTQG